MPQQISTAPDRRAQALTVAHRLLGVRGFNAFSHRDLAESVGVKSSSIHYYFPTKDDIGLALMAQYHEKIAALLLALEPYPPASRVEQFAAVFVQAAEEADHLCLAAMLASDFATLGEKLQTQVQRFFDMTERWLATQASLLTPSLKADEALQTGKMVMSLLEGALLLARAQGDAGRMRQIREAVFRLMSMPSETFLGSPAAVSKG